MFCYSQAIELIFCKLNKVQSGKYLILLKFKDFLGSYDVIYRK